MLNQGVSGMLRTELKSSRSIGCVLSSTTGNSDNDMGAGVGDNKVVFSQKKHKNIWAFFWLFIMTLNYTVTTGLGFFPFISHVKNFSKQLIKTTDQGCFPTTPNPLESVE